jgi:hypothetical protein
VSGQGSGHEGSTPSGGVPGSQVSTLLVVDTADRPGVQAPPSLGWGLDLRPMLTLPGNVRVVIDGKIGDADAARWWSELSIACMYIGIWHDMRVNGPSVLADVDPQDVPNPFV